MIHKSVIFSVQSERLTVFILDPRMVSNSDGLPKQFPTMKNLHHMIYGTFNGKGFLVLLLQLDLGPEMS